MSRLNERLERALEREAPSWGIRPVPADRRRLSGLDLAVLWGDLSVGLLVMVTGALLVPSLGLRTALLAILVGSAIGCLPLALVGLAGEGGFAGTYWGYLAGNAWFYALGALLVLAVGAGADVFGIGTAIATTAGGGVVLIALLVGESDNAFADIYSAAVSTQNVVPSFPQRALIAAVGAVGFLLALSFSMDRYELFLLLIGSVFVPLAAVFMADYFVHHRGRYGEDALFSPTGVRVRALVPWAVGFLLYHWSAPTGPQGWIDAMRTLFRDWLHLPFPLFDSALGASIPSFAVAFALSLVVLRRTRRRGAPTRTRPGVSAGGPRPAR